MFLALQTHWSDSELWALGIARIISLQQEASADYKLLFSWLLHSIYFFDLSNLGTIDTARILFAFIGIGIALQYFRLSFELTKEKGASLWALFLLLSCSYFLSQGFRIRSDLLACLFQISALLCFVKYSKDENPRLNFAATLFFHILMLISTPKAVLHMGVNFLFIVLHLTSLKESPRRVRLFCWLNFGLPLFSVFAMAMIKPESFLGALDFFLNSFQENSRHPGFFSTKSFLYVTRLCMENIPLIVLGISGALFAARSRMHLPKGLVIASIGALAAILIHNDKLPFFIFSLLPLPILLTAVISYKSFGMNANLRGSFFAVTIGVLGINAVVNVVAQLESSNNSLQRESVQIIESYLKSAPGTRYFDGLALLPRDTQIYAFPAPAHYGNLESIGKAIDDPTLNVVFFSNRMFHFMDSLLLALQKNFFIQVGPGVFAKAAVFPVFERIVFTPSVFENMCAEMGAERIHIYVGDDFIKMSPLKNPRAWDCTVKRTEDLEIVTSEPFIAFSKYATISLPKGLSFGQIFAHE